MDSVVDGCPALPGERAGAQREQFRRCRPDISVVIPAYNEEQRLGPTMKRITTYLASQGRPWELLIVDDGSTDATGDVVRVFAAEWPEVRLLGGPDNHGKGHAVRIGALASRGVVVLVTDADLSTPVEEIERLTARLDAGFDVAVGSRHAPGARILVHQPAVRVLMGAVLRFLIMFSGLASGVRDTQCGFKALRGPAARHIFGLLAVDGFAFDIEMLVAASTLGYRVDEVGVTWSDAEGTRVAPLFDSVRVFRDLLNIHRRTRKRLLAAAYAAPDEGPATVVMTVPRAGGASLRASDLVIERTSHDMTVVAFGLDSDQGRAMATRWKCREHPDAGNGEACPAPRIDRMGASVPATLLLGEPESHSDHATAPERIRGIQHNASVERWRQRRRALRILITLNLIGMAWWASWLFTPSHAANRVLYAGLCLAEAFNLVQVLGFWWTVAHIKRPTQNISTVAGDVDVFIATYNEDTDILEGTVRAAVAMTYPHTTHVLDDGNRPAVRKLAARLGARYLAREDNEGAKAGNINNALRMTSGRFVAIFDADHVPHPDFLDRLMPWMSDDRMALVQAPQYYANRDRTYVAAAAMDQQEIFFGPICGGKEGLGAMFCCGTNMVLRREALEAVGGFDETSITEDAVTTLALHEAGWRSKYISEHLADGLAPEDMGAYMSQQRRWAQGNVEMLLRRRPLGRRMPWSLRLQYVWSSSYYLSGFATLLYLSLPVCFLLFGIQTVNPGSTDFIVHFFPYIFMTIFILGRSGDGRVRFRAVQFSYGLFPVFIAATVTAIIGRQVGFKVTPKVGETRSFYRLVLPQLVTVAVMIVAIGFGMFHFTGARTVTNSCWAAFNACLIGGLVWGARPQRIRDAGRVGAPTAAAPATTTTPLGRRGRTPAHQSLLDSAPSRPRRRRTMVSLAIPALAACGGVALLSVRLVATTPAPVPGLARAAVPPLGPIVATTPNPTVAAATPTGSATRTSSSAGAPPLRRAPWRR